MISIIVPVYKVEAYIQKCIDSIQNQTYRDIEIILIDDGSPDNCGAICDDYSKNDERIKVFHTENQGLAAARNVGLKHAQGEYIGFVDSDDWIELDMYETLLRELEKNNSDICISGFFKEYSSETKKKRFEESLSSNMEILDDLINERVNNNVWNKLYRRALFTDVRFPEKKNFEDVAVMHKLLLGSNSIKVISDMKYHYRVREESITQVYSAKNLFDFSDAYFMRYDDLCKCFPKEKKEILLRCPTKGIAKVWRWWSGCSRHEKLEYQNKRDSLYDFTKNNIPLFGIKKWPRYLRVSSFFMHSKNPVSLWLLYWMNKCYRKLNSRSDNCIGE